MFSLARAIVFGVVLIANATAGNILITDLGEGPPGVVAQGGAVIAGLGCIAEACSFTIVAPAGTGGTFPVGYARYAVGQGQPTLTCSKMPLSPNYQTR
jgi:hypothetical protein